VSRSRPLPPWPDSLKIAVVTSRDVPRWRRFAHDVAAAVQPGGQSSPFAEPSSGDGGAEHDRTAFLYRHADQASGYVCLASRLVTGYRSPSAGYRRATDAERIVKPCIMVVWVDAQLRRHGIARQLINAAARYSGVTPSGLAWAEPFTDRGYFLAQAITPGGLWITDYS
jgi:GNAT superfamily N-acetyltransferase